LTDEEFIKAGKEWLAKDKQQELEINRRKAARFQLNNPNYMESYKKKYRENHSDIIRSYHERYNKEYNKTEKGKASKQRNSFNRRKNTNNSINTFTAQQWLQILEEYDYRCAYCGIEFSDINLPTRDHVISISKGGDNTKENIVPACRICNSKKYNKVLERR